MADTDWDPALETGDQVVDAEHRDIYELVCEMERAIETGQDRGVVDGALARILKYARVHFDHEEALMERSSYPDLEHHRGLHQEFAATAASLSDDYLHGVNVSARGLTEFMQAWLVNHIDVEDRKLVDHIRRQAQPA